MTPLQIAKDHCANWRNDGKGCLGAIIDDDLQIRRCRPKPKCVLGTPGERCAYFEECVAPMGPSIDSEDYRRPVWGGEYVLCAGSGGGRGAVETGGFHPGDEAVV